MSKQSLFMRFLQFLGKSDKDFPVISSAEKYINESQIDWYEVLSDLKRKQNDTDEDAISLFWSFLLKEKIIVPLGYSDDPAFLVVLYNKDGSFQVINCAGCLFKKEGDALAFRNAYASLYDVSIKKIAVYPFCAIESDVKHEGFSGHNWGSNNFSGRKGSRHKESN